MANIKDCPGFETFGADVKAARSAKHLSRKTLAEIINIDSRYLANIENDATIPSLPVINATQIRPFNLKELYDLMKNVLQLRGVTDEIPEYVEGKMFSFIPRKV